MIQAHRVPLESGYSFSSWTSFWWALNGGTSVSPEKCGDSLRWNSNSIGKIHQRWTPEHPGVYSTRPLPPLPPLWHTHTRKYTLSLTYVQLEKKIIFFSSHSWFPHFSLTSLLTFKTVSGPSLGWQNNILLFTRTKPEALRVFVFMFLSGWRCTAPSLVVPFKFGYVSRSVFKTESFCYQKENTD